MTGSAKFKFIGEMQPFANADGENHAQNEYRAQHQQSAKPGPPLFAITHYIPFSSSRTTPDPDTACRGLQKIMPVCPVIIYWRLLLLSAAAHILSEGLLSLIVICPQKTPQPGTCPGRNASINDVPAICQLQTVRDG
jgi:hypothetical protein